MSERSHKLPTKECQTSNPDLYMGALYVGKELVIAEDLSARCCTSVIPAESRIRIAALHSKKQVIVQVLSCPTDTRFINTLHKVRANKIMARPSGL